MAYLTKADAELSAGSGDTTLAARRIARSLSMALESASCSQVCRGCQQPWASHATCLRPAALRASSAALDGCVPAVA